MIQEAAATGAKVIVFPEALIGGYPKGLNYGLVVDTRDPAGREEFRCRPDIFQLIVNEAPTPAVVTKTGE